MLIDWFTVVAQVLNFIILVWLMKRFLYRPILDAIDAREQRIATDLASAARNETEAQKARDKFQKKIDELDQERGSLMQQAGADADNERRKLIGAARAAADALAAKRSESLVSETTGLVRALQLRVKTEVLAITRQALAELVGVSLEASASALFVARLQTLQGAPRDALANALDAATDAVVVRSAFALPDAQRMAIQQTIRATFGFKPELRFEVEPELIAGIELVAQSHKFSWNIGDYLASLEHAVGELLKASSHASTPSTPAVHAQSAPAHSADGLDAVAATP